MAYFSLIVAPRWTSKPGDVVDVPIEGDKQILCEAVGFPPPTYRWYYNGTLFKSPNEL